MNTAIFNPEEKRHLCNIGQHWYVLDKITDCNPWLVIIVKWKCLFCKKEVEKEVSPVD